MSTEIIHANTEAFAQFVRDLRLARRHRKLALRDTVARRRALSARERQDVFRKTAGRCHICGGVIDGPWHVDHVFAHAAGGTHAADNYLPAHALCNNYRWDYSADEFQIILKLGVWLRNQIEQRSPLGLQVAERFLGRERVRRRRRKQPVLRQSGDA
jgi:hypothetical protein